MSKTTTLCTNGKLDIVPMYGGACQVAISSNTGQGNGGTSLACKKVILAAPPGNTGYIRVNLCASATSVLGVVVPNGPAGASISACLSDAVQPTPMELEIDDVSKLYFWGAVDGDVVDLIYRQ